MSSFKARDQLFEENITSEEKQHQNFLPKVYSFVIDSMINIINQKYSTESTWRTQLATEISISIIMTIQTISIFWNSQMSMSNWDNYSWFWNYLWILSFDNYCVEFGIFSSCFTVLSVIIHFPIKAAILFGILRHSKKKTPWLIGWLARKVLTLLATIAFIPSLTIFFVVFKYSTFHATDVKEYYNSHISDFDYGPIGAIISIFSILALILSALSEVLFTADIRHQNFNKNLKARSNSVIDLLFVIFCSIECGLYVLVGENNYPYYIVTVLFMSSIILIKLFKFLPYYNLLENLIVCGKLSAISTIAFIFLFGYSLDDAGVLTIMVFFVPALIIAFAIHFMRVKYLTLAKRTISFSDQFSFEHSIRHNLINKNLENKSSITDVFSKCYDSKSFKKNELFVFWEVNFCLDVIEDERLGRVKLTKIRFLKPSLEGNIQKARMFKRLAEEHSAYLPEVEYLEYLLLLNEAKEKDEEICYSLLDLWDEIVRKNANEEKLMRITRKVSDLAQNIREVYGSLITKNKYSEVYELYGSFLDNILGESEEGSSILKRKKRFGALDSMLGYRRKLGDYDENSGIMLISANSDSFGSIAYINEKGGQILKVSQAEIIGTNLANFIPKPYSTTNNQQMKKYLSTCNDTFVKHPSFLFLLDHDGYLFECSILIKLTAFQNDAYFITSFSPCSYKRSIILLSDSGEIHAFSQLIPHFFGVRSEQLQNRDISQFIPGLQISSMFLYDPWIIELNDKEFALIHITKKIRKVILHALLVVNDPKEIEIWSNGQAAEQTDHLNKILKTDTSLSIIDQTPSGNYERIHIQFAKEILSSISHDERLGSIAMSGNENVGLLEEEEKSVSQNQSNVSQSIASTNKLAFAYIQKTERAIKVFQLVLFFTIFSMIATNAGILVYIVDDVSHTNELETFSNLGEALFYIGDIAGIIKSINLELTYGVYNLTSDLEYLEKVTQDLLSLQNTLLDDLPKWRYCDSSDIVINDIIPVWEFDGKPHLSYRNLYDTFTLFIENNQDIIKHAQTKSSINSEMQWLVINSLTFSYDHIKSALSGLVNCESVRIKENGAVINALLILGILVLGVCFLVLLYFIIVLKIIYEKFWEFIRKAAISAYFTLKQASLDRLSGVHGTDLSFDNNSNIKSMQNQDSHIKSKTVLKFSWRLFFFASISLAYYLLIYLYLYENCQKYMINRPKLLQNFNSRRALLSRISFYARERTRPSLNQLYPSTYAFPNSNIGLQTSIKEYQEEYSRVKKEGLKELMSETLKIRLYEEISGSDDISRFGVGSAAQSIIFDSSYLSGPTEIYAFIRNISSLQQTMSDAFTLINSSSKDVVANQLDLIIYITIAFSIGLALLYLLYYLPFLSFEKKKLKQARILPPMIPKSLVSDKR
ncbi:unnamed protein product [Blepharisma stoltei]|uniref:TmcB/TmcC TPR repeats domain-containing protein n=1 Tax=Blepharisma stoltei TaxID=1481888 RepID=A0AAU9IWS6_9CILI|nr:unnamed protein product [Blepharisma stoltei]